MIPKKLYHATYEMFLDSIKARGLGNIRRKINSYSKPGVVALSETPSDALMSIEWTEWVEHSDDFEYYYNTQVVLEVDTSLLDENLFTFIDETSGWEYNGFIPWEACRVLTSIEEEFEEYSSMWNAEDKPLAEAMSPEEKVDAWHDGTRPVNYKAAKDDKLKKYLNIAKDRGYKDIIAIIEAELIARGSAEPVKVAAPEVVEEGPEMYVDGEFYRMPKFFHEASEAIDEMLNSDINAESVDFYDDNYFDGEVVQWRAMWNVFDPIELDVDQLETDLTNLINRYSKELSIDLDKEMLKDDNVLNICLSYAAESITENYSTLVEAPKDFTDSEFPSMLRPNKVYTLTGNYWFCPEFDGYSADTTIKQMLLDPTPENEKYIRQHYVQEAENISFCNTTSKGASKDKALFFPKGKQLKFIKDVVVSNDDYQMFTDGKVVLLLGPGINKYLQ